MVWDLSRSVPTVFRSPGNPLIKLFHLKLNLKCNFQNPCFLLIVIVLPIVLPIDCVRRGSLGPIDCGVDGQELPIAYWIAY